MIPPSYLFKSIYQNEWLDQPVPLPPQRSKFYKGLVTPLLQGLSAALHRRQVTGNRRFLTPACD